MLIDLRLNDVVYLIDEIDRIQYSQEESEDVIGRVYEYFLRKFCIAAKSEKGEFYTPGNIVELMTLLIQPYSGSVYDPCCGSGGMFVQSAEFIKRHKGNKKDITIYGQESNDKTYKLARMNLAIRGLNCDLGDMDASTFTSDKHPNLRADFILANPPFNLKDWRTENELRNDRRWDGYEVPPVSNANYAWLQHMLHHLNPAGGVAGTVLANGSLSTQTSGEGDIRKNMIEDDVIECIVSMPSQLFYSVAIPVSLWIMRKGKTGNAKGKILFIDARNLGHMVDRRVRELSEEDIQKIASTYQNWRQGKDYEDMLGFCKEATLDDVAGQEYILTPGRYVGIPEDGGDGEPFEEKMARLTSELSVMFDKSIELQREIRKSLGALGYDI